MAQRSWFFNSTPDDKRVYQASDFARYFGKVLSTGLLHIDEVPGLQVKADGTDLRTYVEPGGAIMEGYAYENTDNEYLTHSLPEVNLDRIDRIVLRLDKKNANRYIKLFVREGEPSTEPIAPALQRDNLVWELSLAQVRIRANTSSISPSDVFDERLDRTVCGLTFSLISKPAMADIQTGGYAVTATVEGQTDFEIPLESFDKVGDGLTVFVGGKKAEYSSYQVLYPRTVRFNVGLPISTKVEFEIIRGVLKLEDDYVVNAGEVGIIDSNNYYDSENVEGALQQIGEKMFAPQPKKYGVRFDLSDPNPVGERTYDAVGLVESDFENIFPFNKIKPCVLKNGVVQYYLNPNDFTKKVDGTESNIHDSGVGDVMIEFPKIYWLMEKDTNYQHIIYSEFKINDSYCCYANTNGNVEYDKYYIGAFLGYVDETQKLRSVSGKTIVRNDTFTGSRNSARKNGAGYQLLDYFKVLANQILYSVRYADRNYKKYFTLNTTITTVTGGANDKGMNVGPGATLGKFFGLEQYALNVPCRIEGIQLGPTIKYTLDATKYSDEGSLFNNTNLFTLKTGNYIASGIQGDNIGGFILKEGQGSTSTYYCDQQLLYANGDVYHQYGQIYACKTDTQGVVPTGSVARLAYM